VALRAHQAEPIGVSAKVMLVRVQSVALYTTAATQNVLSHVIVNQNSDFVGPFLKNDDDQSVNDTTA
jgi:hypothetical protein